MRVLWDSNRQPAILDVTVTTKRPEQVMIAVYDWKKKNTVYSKQVVDINGREQFEIPLPYTPEKAFFEVSVVGGGNLPFGLSDNLDVQVNKLPFVRPMRCNFEKDPMFRDFMNLILWFSENAGILSAAYGNNPASIYKSASGRFQMKYVPVIIDDLEFFDAAKTKRNPNFGKPSPTSFRVNAVQKGHMETAQNYVVDYTFPQRVVLGVHEGGHDFISANPESEEEADYHAILICRCIGFGKREIGQAFTKVFNRYPSPENAKRIQLIKHQLENMK